MKEYMPLEDAGVLAVLMNNASWTLQEDLKMELLNTIKTAHVREIANAIVGDTQLDKLSPKQQRIAKRILAYKQEHGFLAPNDYAI